MDISINNNKYAKQEALQNMANAVDEELAKLNNTLNFYAEYLDTRIALSTALLENEKNRLELMVTATQAVITDMVVPKEQKKAVQDKIDEMEQTVEKAFKLKDAQHKKEYQQMIAELKEKYGISADIPLD